MITSMETKMNRMINGKEYPDDLTAAKLARADLTDANLRGADLTAANLTAANLARADLADADLSRAKLAAANLAEANLRGADLSRADLSDADLARAKLADADLTAADLAEANLARANLTDADLRGAKNISPLAAARLSICPAGAIIGWKKLADGKICKLLIPDGAKRSNATGRKCRAEFAVVLEGEGVSTWDGIFEYRIGETVRPREPFCDDRWAECASGIHFYLTREEAEAH